MDATFTPEQRLLQDTATRMAEEIGASTVEMLSKRDVSGGTRLLADAGFIGLHLPSELGGSAASAVEVAIVTEALARRASPVPFLGPVLAAELLVLAGAGQEVVVGLTDGSRRISLGLSTALMPLGEDGARRPVAWDAAGAEEAAVLRCQGGGTHEITLVPVTGSPADCIDLTRVAVEIPDPRGSAPLDRTIDADASTRWMAFALAMLCADMVGAMTGALEMAVAHASHRVQFGRPIGAFQAIQHLCAEQHVSIEAARSATYYAAWAVDGLADPSEALIAARTAKAYVSREAPVVAEANLQVHGGIGQSWDSLAHVFLRRIILDAATLGDEHVQLAALAGFLDELAMQGT